MKQQPTLVERFADNGGHSHWDLIDASNGELLWSGDDELYSDHPQPNREREMKTKEEIFEAFEKICRDHDYFNHRIFVYDELKAFLDKSLTGYSDQQNKEMRENFIGRAYKIIHHLISKHDFDHATIYSVNAFLTEIKDCCKKNNDWIGGIHWDQNDYPVNSEAEIQRLTTEKKELEEKLMSEQIENGYLQGFRVSNEAEIQRLREGVEELKNDLPDALDLKNGNGPTALTMLSNELTRLRELVTQYLDNSTSDNAYGADVRDRILNELNPKRAKQKRT